MTKFAEIKEQFKLPSDWPGSDVIEAMTVYAEGLFIWADMVIKYIGAKT